MDKFESKVLSALEQLEEDGKIVSKSDDNEFPKYIRE